MFTFLKKCLLLLFILFLSSPNLATEEEIAKCHISLKHDLRPNSPFLVPAGRISEAFYPEPTRASVIEIPGGSSDLHIVCPNSTIVANRRNLHHTSAVLICHNNSYFHVNSVEEQLYRFADLSCAKRPETEERETNDNCTKFTCLQIGYTINVMEFSKVLYIASSRLHEHVVVSAEVQPTVQRAHKPKAQYARVYQVGIFFDEFETTMTEVWSKSYQIERLAETLGEDDLAKKYMTTFGSQALVPTELMLPENLMYAHEQEACYWYENTVPMWKTVADNNWRLVSKIVRKFASEYNTRLLVSAGTLGVLKLPDYIDKHKKLYLTINEGDPFHWPVPENLYVIIFSNELKIGLAIIVQNNPFFKHATICKPINFCDLIYPSFQQVKKGSAYCCLLEDFLPLVPKIS